MRENAIKLNALEFRMRDEFLDKLGLLRRDAAEETKVSFPFSFAVEDGTQSFDIQGWTRAVSGNDSRYTITWRNPGLPSRSAGSANG